MISRNSLEDTRNLLREIREPYPDKAPVILVGCKIESRSDPEVVHELYTTGDREGPILTEEGERAALEMGALKYMECATGNAGHIDAIFQEVGR